MSNISISNVKLYLQIWQKWYLVDMFTLYLLGNFKKPLYVFEEELKAIKLEFEEYDCYMNMQDSLKDEEKPDNLFMFWIFSYKCNHRSYFFSKFIKENTISSQ